MAKDFNVQQAVATLLSASGDVLPSKAKLDDLRQMLLLLSRIARGANKRAKEAEEMLEGQPLWKKKYDDQKRMTEKLVRDNNGLEARIEALKTDHREALLQQGENLQADLQALEEQVAQCSEMNMQMADALAAQENESREQIAHLQQVNQTLREHSNALSGLLVAERRVTDARLVLALLGCTFRKSDDA